MCECVSVYLLGCQRDADSAVMVDVDIFPDLPEDVRREVLLVSQKHIIYRVRYLKVRGPGCVSFFPYT